MTRYYVFFLSLIATLALAGCEPGSVPSYKLGSDVEPVDDTATPAVDDDTDTGTGDDDTTTTPPIDPNDQDGDGDPAIVESDCDDSDPDVYNGAPELCDSKDNDCDGAIDDGLDQYEYRIDADGDTYGDQHADAVWSCQKELEGYVLDATDCNDADAETYPGAGDLPGDGIDSNCDDGVDAGDTGTSEPEEEPATDADADGYTDAVDCNDVDTAIYPGATETCDSVDDDCDGSVDEGATSVFYDDGDGDGYGDASDTSSASCTAPAGYVGNDDDCDDSDASVYNGATEVFDDGIDSDCDGNENSGFAGTVIATYPNGSSYTLTAAFYNEGSFPNEFSWQSSVSSTVIDGYSEAQAELTDEDLDEVGTSCGVIVNGTGSSQDNLCWGGERDEDVELEVWIAASGWLTTSPVVWIADASNGSCAVVFQTNSAGSCDPVNDN